MTVDVAAIARAAVTGPVREVVVVPSRYATSHSAAEVDVVRPDGTVVELLFKDLSPSGVLAEAVGRRPGFVDDPWREVAVYLDILEPAARAGAGLGTARCLASSALPPLGTGLEGGSPSDVPAAWLVLERVAGTVLWQVGELDVWRDVVRWAARLHTTRFDLTEPEVTSRLVSYDRAWFARWPIRSRQHLAGAGPAQRVRLDRALRSYDEVVDALVALPRHLVHGELYASNVMVVPATRRICAIDWEMAGIGAGALDVAALVAGDWDATQRHFLVRAYHDALGTAQDRTLEELVLDVTRSRLNQCFQWLGWSSGWDAPAAHGRDWLSEALECSEELGL